MTAGVHVSLFDHAARLLRETPDDPLPLHGEPLPDQAAHQRYDFTPADDRRRTLLAAYLASESGSPADLGDALHGPEIGRCEWVAAVAARADPDRVLRTGRALVRHGTDRCAVAVGLALLACVPVAGDRTLIRTVGLLGERFGPAAVEALERRPGGAESLVWLAQRTRGRGRAHAVAALCRLGAGRDWLLRHACDDDLDAGLAWRVAVTAGLDRALRAGTADDRLVDHTTRLLSAVLGASGADVTPLLAAHLRHLARQTPTAARFRMAGTLARRLPPEARGGYLAVLDRPDWCAAVRADWHDHDGYYEWFAVDVARPLALVAFDDFGKGAT